MCEVNCRRKCYNIVMKPIKKLAKKIIPQRSIDALHYPEAKIYARKHKHPSSHMIIIGVVGSKGKTTTANMIWAVLSASGAKVGQIGTANIRIGDKEELNKYHMTMPGAPAMQKILAQMKTAGCKYVVMEVPSEAQTQWRHVGINFDMLVFTNVEREIMASHRNSMDVLHQHNKRVFTAMAKSKPKVVDNQEIPKTIIANNDSPDHKAYMNFDVDVTATFSTNKPSDYWAKDIVSDGNGVDLVLSGQKYHTNILGSINAENAAAAIAVGKELGLSTKTIQTGLAALKTIPGRMEPIDEGQNFTVLVDYAHSPASMDALMHSALKMAKGKIITLLGAEGGGRDVEKRPILGRIVGKYSTIVVITNVDPYEDNPQTIIDDIARGARENDEKIDEKDLFCIEDRRAGIRKALTLAAKNDLVLITGKGAEQSIVINGKSRPWDDRKVVREELKKIVKK
jgi:UDP-N-acetylmuramoyl-L-alanyl-D-glutamate--2,6-diaminopimelate ligase